MILDSLFGPSPRRQPLGYKLTDERLGSILGVPATASGKHVTRDTALSLSAVFGAVRLLSQIKAALPLSVYRRRADGGRAPALGDRVHQLLHTQPNPEMTSKRFRETLEWHRYLGGNAYAEIEFRGDGQPLWLWPLESWRVKPERDAAGVLFYRIDGRRTVTPRALLHIPLVSSDGVSGRSFLDYAGESLGSALAAQEYAAAFFGNGAWPGGLFEHPGQPTELARKFTRESWEKLHGGAKNAHRIGVLWGGIKFNKDAGSVDPEKSQLVNVQIFQVQEVARWLNIPPHLLAELSRATFSNIEHQFIQFLVFTLNPVCVDYEQEYDRKLLTPPEVFSKHNVTALLRADSKARGEFYGKLFQIGALSTNDVLELEDRNPIGPAGDLRFVPINMQTLEQAARAARQPQAPVEPEPDEPDPDDEPEEPEENHAVRDAHEQLLADAFARLLRKEANEARRAAEKPDRFLIWRDRFYAAHEPRLARALAPAVVAWASVRGRPAVAGGIVAARWAGHWVEQSARELLEVAGQATPAELPAAIAGLVERWASRPAALAREILDTEVAHEAAA